MLDIYEKGADGEGDSVTDVYSSADAVFEALNYLLQLRRRREIAQRHTIAQSLPRSLWFELADFR